MRRAKQAISHHCDDADTPSKKRKADTVENDLAEFVLKRWTSAKPFTDKDFATMAYFHGTVGGDTLAKFALNPNTRGRNRARKVRGALGVLDVSDDVAVIKTFKWDWKRNRQKEAELHVRLPQDIFRKHYDAKTWSTRHLDPDLWDVPASTQHEITVQNGTDTAIGGWFVFRQGNFVAD